MTENRLSRELDTREAKKLKPKWNRPETLPSPTPQPGYAFRWIRVAMQGQADPTNVSSKIREGWEPVRIEEQPRFRLLVDPNSRFKDNIEIGGLLLCKTPDDFVKQRNEYYEQQTKMQTEAVDSTLMRQSDPRMPLFNERKSSTSFGSGS